MAAGVATAALFMLTSLFFTAAGRRIGSTYVNAIRICLGIIMLGVTHRMLAGTWYPEVLPRQAVILAVSGVLGLTLGDHALFTAFVHMGPRLPTLIMTTSPLFAALFAWAALGEVLSPLAWIGVVITLGGIAWVVNERQPDGSGRSPYFLRGIGLALIGSACQAGGLMLSKQGMGHGWLEPSEHLNPQAATLVRMTWAGVASIPLVIWRMRRTAQDDERLAVDWKAGFGYTALGAIVGPYLGVWMSLIASDRAPVAVAQTLVSLVPIFILPMVVIVYRERVSARAVVGAIIAVGGAVLLFVEPS
jgi:drug/metabolite transporter (DMT)-like permease